MGRTYFSVLTIGRDSPGIVAAVSGVLANSYACNIETSQMTIVSGHFCVALIASSDTAPDYTKLAEDLERDGEKPNARKVAVSQLEDFQPADLREATHGITVQATDRPGVLHEVAQALAAHQINITSLTSLCSDENSSLCIISLDVVLLDGTDGTELEQAVFDSVDDDVHIRFEDLQKRRDH